MAADPRSQSISVEAYLELDRSSVDTRYEFIDGVVTMLAGGTANHSRISINIIKALDNALHGKGCIVFNSDMRVKISPTRFLYPDVSVSCDPRDQEQGDLDIISYPCIVIEVLSASTEAYDRIKKFSYYRSCPSIQEYVLVSTHEQAVDIYQRATENLWTLHLFGPGDEIEVRSLNIRFPLATIYENILLSSENI
jgi:Uma2 family endonuclease